MTLSIQMSFLSPLRCSLQEMKGLLLIESDVVTLTSHILLLPMPLPLSSTVETYLTTRPSTQDALLGVGQPRLEDVFANLILDRAPYIFPTLSEEEKQVIKVIFGGRSNLKVNGLEVVRSLKRLLTIHSDIQTMYDESYNCYVALVRQIALHIKKP